MIDTSLIVYEWDEGYFLRDDQAAGICGYRRYSLFRREPYGRVMVYAGRESWALEQADGLVEVVRGSL